MRSPSTADRYWRREGSFFNEVKRAVLLRLSVFSLIRSTEGCFFNEVKRAVLLRLRLFSLIRSRKDLFLMRLKEQFCYVLVCSAL